MIMMKILLMSDAYALTSFLQALAGEVGMSSELDDVARSLFNGVIPSIWRRLAPDTLKSLGNWMLHFDKRYQQYNIWVIASLTNSNSNTTHVVGWTRQQ